MLLARGAEAVLRKEGDKVVKERISKGYRLKELDSLLRKKRTRAEAKIMQEARRAGADVPLASEKGESTLEIEFVEGELVKDFLEEENADDVGKAIGAAIGKIHSNGIIHGDLTTSNMIMQGDKIFFIDFGLGFRSQRIEDSAVDLYLLKEVIAATHHEIEEKLWRSIIRVYTSNSDQAEKVIKTLLQIEKRGRYRKRD